MKRFYRTATSFAVPDGFEIHLDEKPLKTPRKNVLRVTQHALAEAVQAEWDAQEDEIRPHAMPLTQLANGVCDLTDEEQGRLVAHMAGYIDGDMLYFREEEHRDLFPRQEAEWEPWLCWAEQRYDIRLQRQYGIAPGPQAPEVHQRLRDVLEHLSLAQLVPLNVLATGFGSLLLALAVLENALPVEEAFELSLLEQRVQTDRWGLEEEQRQRNDELRAEVSAAARFLALLAEE